MTVQEDFAANIKDLRGYFGVTQKELATALGVSTQTVSAWETGAVVTLLKYVPEIATYFGVPSEALIQPNIATRIDPVSRKMRSMPKVMEGREPYTTNTSAPMYGKIAAGKPIETIAVDDRLWVSPDVLGEHPRGFYLHVAGESMNRVLPGGSYAFVDPDAEICENDVVAVTVNGDDATIKRILRGRNTVILKPDSMDPTFTDLIFDLSTHGTDSITTIGRVVWYVAPYGGRL